MKIIWHQLIQPPQSDFARSLPAWALIILAVCAFAGSSGAATVTKNNTFTMQANTTDWSAAPGTTDIGSFTGTIDAAHEAGLTLGGSLSMGELLFNGTLAGPASIGNDGNTLTLNSATAIVASSQNKNVTINCPLTITTAGNNFEAINAGTFTLTLGGYLTGPSNGNVIWRGGTGIFSGGGSYTSLNIQSRASVTAAVKLGANNGVATSATIGLINTASGGTANFDLAGFNQTLIGITNVASALGYITNSVTGTSVLTLTGTSTYGSTLVDSGGANKLALVVNGGTLTLSGANTYSGGTTLTNAGQLNINNARAIGATASTFTITGGTTIDNTSAGAITLTNNNAQNWNGDFTYAGSVPNNLNLGTGAVTLGASRQVTVTAGNLTVGGIVSGSGFGLTKLGAGTLTLINANTYSGATVVSSGTLILNGSLNLASAVSVVGGSATLGGTGSAGAVNVASGGILAAGTGVLTMTNLAFPDSATVNLTPNAATAPIKVTGSNGLNPSGGASTVTLNVGLGFLSAGTFHLIQHSGNIQNSGLSAFVLGTNPGGAFTYTLVDNAGYLDLQVAAAADVWTGAFSTEWSVNTITSPKNWQVSGSPVDYADGQAVIFDDTATGTTVDISAADVNPNGVQFYNSTKSYTLQGSKAITGSSALTIIGTNTVTISNTNSFTGAVTINGGTLSINTIASNSVNSALGGGTSINLGGKLSYTGSMASSDRTVTLTTNSTIEVTNAATILTLAGTVGGSANLTKAGSGTLTLSGTGNYTGNTVISAGTLSIGDPGQLGGGSYAGGINVAGSGAFVYSSTAAQTLLGAITGGGSLSQSGGTLTLSGTNTYGGVTTISAGTLTIDITGRLGNGNYATNIINNSAFVCNSTNLQTLSGIISGTGTVTQSGSGTTTLSGTNTYGGGTILGGNAGSLVAANNSAFGTGAVVFNSGSSGAIRMNNGVIITNGITFNGGGTGAATGAIEPNTSAANATLSGGTITINAETSGGGHFGSPSLTNMLTIADPITSSVNVVWRRGLGTLSGGGSYVNLSLANASGNNSYIKLGANNGISTSASVDVASVSTLDLAGYNQTLVGISNGGTITNSSTITSSMLTLTGDLTFPGKIKDGGSPATLALNISGGAVTLSGTNTYTGATTISAGTLTIDVAGQLGGGNYAGLIANNTVLVYNSTAVQILSGTISGTGMLTNSGGGTLTLSASTNSYSGGTEVNNGIIYLNGNLNTASAVSVAGGAATLGGTGSAGVVTVSSSGSVEGGEGGVGALTLTSLAFSDLATVVVTPNAMTAPLKITASNGLNPAGGGNSVTINLGGGALSAGTYHLIQYNGIIQGSGFGAFQLGATPGGFFSYALVSDANYVDLQVTTVADAWTGAFSTEWSVNTITSPKNWQVSGSPVDYADGQNVLFDDSATGTNVNISVADVNPATVQFLNSTKNYTVQGSKAIAGGVGVLMTGSGKVTINNVNSFTGPVTINAGTLSVNTVAIGGANSALGAGTSIVLGGGKLSYTGGTASSDRTVTLNSDSTVEVTTAASALILGGTIDGNAVLTKTGNGTLTLTNANTYASNLSVSAGTLSIGDPSQLNNGIYAGLITNNGAFVYASSANQTNSGVISGAGKLVQDGSGTLALTGVNTYTGNTTISAGMLTIGDAGQLGGGNYAGNITNNSSLVLASSAAQTLSGIISGTGLLTESGSSMITLSGANTYSGGTILSGGNFVAANNSAFGTGTVTNNTGIIHLVINDGVTITNSITINGGSAGTGTGLIQNSGTGSATLSGGTISINASAGSGHFMSASGGTLTIADPINSSVPVIWRAGNGIISGGGNYANYTIQTAAAIDGNTSTNALGANNGFSTNVTLNITGNGSYIDLAGYNQTLVAVTSGGNIGNSSTTSDSVLTTTGTNTYGGVIKDVLASGTRKVAVTVNGGALTLSGTNTYSGNTTISAGTLALGATGSILNSPNLVIAGGATFDVSAAAYLLGNGQTLSNSTSTAVLNGNVNASSGTVSLTYATGTPALNVNTGTLTLAPTTAFKVNNTGAALAVGSYKLISTNLNGTVNGTVPTSVAVGGNGVAGTALLSISNSELYLVVALGVNTNSPVLTNGVSGGSLNLSWPTDHIGWRLLLQTNNLASGISSNTNDWGTVAGSAATNQMSIPIDATKPMEFYRLGYP